MSDGPRLASLPSPLVALVERRKPCSPPLYAVAGAWVEGPDCCHKALSTGYGPDPLAAAADALERLGLMLGPAVLAEPPAWARPAADPGVGLCVGVA